MSEGRVMRAACHCGAVRFEIARPPAWVMDCSCTLCRRYGALWTYYRGQGQALLLSRPSADLTDTYLWGDRAIAFHRCKVCGCMTHMAAVDTDPPTVFGVNARMFVGLDPAAVTVRRIDNGHVGAFFTRPDEPVIPGQHPPMPPPGPDDWR